MGGEGGAHVSEPEPRFKRILCLLNINICFESKVMLKVKSKNSENRLS